MEAKTSEKSILNYLKEKKETKPEVKLQVEKKPRITWKQFYDGESEKAKVLAKEMAKLEREKAILQERVGKLQNEKRKEKTTKMLAHIEKRQAKLKEKIENIKNPKKEEPKPEIKPKEKTPDKEAEEIKKKLENVTDEKVLKKPDLSDEAKKSEAKKPEPIEIKIPEIKIPENWLWVIGIIVLIVLGLKLLSGRSSSQIQISTAEKQPSQPAYREMNIGTPERPRIIRIPIQ